MLNITADLNESIETWCTKNNCDKNLFCERKSNTLQNVDFRTPNLSRNFDIKESSCTLKEIIVKEHLKYLHCKNVIARQKTKGNVRFVCQRFYILVVVGKFRLLNSNSNNNQTSKQVSNSNIMPINNYSNILKIIFNTKLSDAKKQLFHMHWTLYRKQTK